ncbi:gamma-glutamylcyclotransferase family protein [Aspergillus undulatus]|uniref:gamma-glutamylcyclotransferase family protein n=1 Tax=Aspergillus undulatus TaxID=1810928 RepID=UPI003CCDBF37
MHYFPPSSRFSQTGDLSKPKVECNESYPDEFKATLNRSPLKNGEIETLCSRSSFPPIFVYDHLMLPTVLKYFADVPSTSPTTGESGIDMIPATLPDHKLYHFSEKGEPGLPVIKPSMTRGDAVQGMLIFGLTPEQRSDISELECGISAQNIIADVRVHVSFIGKIHGYDAKCWKYLDAAAFVWRPEKMDMQGLEPMSTSYWPVDGFLAGQLYANIVEQQSKVEDEMAYSWHFCRDQ